MQVPAGDPTLPGVCRVNDPGACSVHMMAAACSAPWPPCTILTLGLRIRHPKLLRLVGLSSLSSPDHPESDMSMSSGSESESLAKVTARLARPLRLTRCRQHTANRSLKYHSLVGAKPQCTSAIDAQVTFLCLLQAVKRILLQAAALCSQ